jgi:hypothetical protein
MDQPVLRRHTTSCKLVFFPNHILVASLRDFYVFIAIPN